MTTYAKVDAETVSVTTEVSKENLLRRRDSTIGKIARYTAKLAELNSQLEILEPTEILEK